MKIRVDFVTNSSSSSYICFSITSHILVDIIKEFEREIVEDNEKNMMLGFSIDGDTISKQEGDVYLDEAPYDLLSALNTMIELTVGEDYCDYPISEDENENKEKDLSILEDANADWRMRFAAMIFKHRKEILEDIENVDCTYQDACWGGDGDSRFEESMYSKRTLKKMYKEIAKENGVKANEVTEDMFFAYVANKTSIDEQTFTYDKTTGKSKYKTRFFVED